MKLTLKNNAKFHRKFFIFSIFLIFYEKNHLNKTNQMVKSLFHGECQIFGIFKLVFSASFILTTTPCSFQPIWVEHSFGVAVASIRLHVRLIINKYFNTVYKLYQICIQRTKEQMLKPNRTKILSCGFHRLWNQSYQLEKGKSLKDRVIILIKRGLKNNIHSFLISFHQIRP